MQNTQDQRRVGCGGGVDKSSKGEVSLGPIRASYQTSLVYQTLLSRASLNMIDIFGPIYTISIIVIRQLV
ncbi:hypothetical protein HYDPIDRAFT_156482, partial [Hydnomerulius pinastri MD-312]